MTTTEFEKIVDARLTKVKELLRGKQAEYAKDEDDRLEQFRKAGFLMGTNSINALLGMMSKHTTSIYNMAKNMSIYPQEMWQEKITDHIAYLLFLEGLLSDCFWRYDRDGEE